MRLVGGTTVPLLQRSCLRTTNTLVAGRLVPSEDIISRCLSLANRGRGLGIGRHRKAALLHRCGLESASSVGEVRCVHGRVPLSPAWSAGHCLILVDPPVNPREWTRPRAICPGRRAAPAQQSAIRSGAKIHVSCQPVTSSAIDAQPNDKVPCQRQQPCSQRVFPGASPRAEQRKGDNPCYP